MRRFYCEVKNIQRGFIYIKDKQEVHHIKDVLRMKKGNKIIVFSDNGCEYTGLIYQVKPHYVLIKIQNIKPGASGSAPENDQPSITLACAVPKRSKIDYIIEKATELGVNEFIPLKTKRTVVDLRGKEEFKIARWQRVARSAAKQCGRIDVPKILSVLSLKQALSYIKDCDLAIIPNLNNQRKHIKDLIKKSRFKNIVIFIGPEGDFTEDEIDLALKYGCIPVSLGKNTLRVDTAAIAVVSLLTLGT